MQTSDFLEDLINTEEQRLRNNDILRLEDIREAEFEVRRFNELIMEQKESCCSGIGLWGVQIFNNGMTGCL